MDYGGGGGSDGLEFQGDYFDFKNEEPDPQRTFHTPLKFTEKVIQKFMSQDNIQYLSYEAGFNVTKNVIDFQNTARELLRDNSVYNGQKDFTSEVKRLNVNFLSYIKSKQFRDVGGRDSYQTQMFTADSLYPPGLEVLNERVEVTPPFDRDRRDKRTHDPALVSGQAWRTFNPAPPRGYWVPKTPILPKYPLPAYNPMRTVFPNTPQGAPCKDGGCQLLSDRGGHGRGQKEKFDPFGPRWQHPTAPLNQSKGGKSGYVSDPGHIGSDPSPMQAPTPPYDSTYSKPIYNKLSGIQTGFVPTAVYPYRQREDPRGNIGPNSDQMCGEDDPWDLTGDPYRNVSDRQAEYLNSDWTATYGDRNGPRDRYMRYEEFPFWQRPKTGRGMDRSQAANLCQLRGEMENPVYGYGSAGYLVD